MSKWLACLCCVEEENHHADLPIHFQRQVTRLKNNRENAPQSYSNGSTNSSSRNLSATSDVPKVPLQIQLPVLSLDDLKHKTDNFGKKTFIGAGTYGKVYLVQLDSGNSFVVKKLDNSSRNPDCIYNFLSKVSILANSKHANFVEFHGYYAKGDTRILAYEYAKHGSLYDILHGKKGEKDAKPALVLSWMQRLTIAVEVARGLQFLHERKEMHIIHKGVKSANVLLFDDYKAKIADFYVSDLPISRDKDESPDMGARLDSTRFLGAFGYQAPEYAMTGQWSKLMDVYSFGVLLLELLTGRKPVDYNVPSKQRSLVTWASARFSEDKCEELVDPKLDGGYSKKGVAQLAGLVAICVQYDPDRRPNMSIILQRLENLQKGEARDKPQPRVQC